MFSLLLLLIFVLDVPVHRKDVKKATLYVYHLFCIYIPTLLLAKNYFLISFLN